MESQNVRIVEVANGFLVMTDLFPGKKTCYIARTPGGAGSIAKRIISDHVSELKKATEEDSSNPKLDIEIARVVGII